MPPAGHLLFLSRQEKKAKEGDPTVCDPALRSGQPAVLVRGVRRGTRYALRAALEQPRRASSRSGCVLRHTRHPTPCAPRRIQKGEGKAQTAAWAIALLGPAFAGASASRCVGQAEQSDGPCGLRSSTPFWLRLRRGVCGVSMRVGARMLRHLTRRVCPNGARQRAVSYAAHPASAPTQVCPFAARRGRRLRGAFLCLPWRARPPSASRPRPPRRRC